MKRGIFIERDGILNEASAGDHQRGNPVSLVEFRVKDVLRLLEALKREKFLLIATTNQPGLSRGYQSRRELDQMHALLRAKLPLDDILVCPHDATDCCPCRKPRPGLLLEASFKWQINLEYSFVLSDKWQDAEAARIAGCTSLLVQSSWNGNVHRDFLVRDTEAAVQKILDLKNPALATA